MCGAIIPQQPVEDLLDFLEDERVRLILVGGKGGVGKTTTAAALSLHLARRSPARRYLTVSTSPFHSLSDIFGFPLESTPKPVYGMGNLAAAEINTRELFLDFKARHGPILGTILHRGTYLDEEDISRFLDLSFPGLDELMAMIGIIDLLESNRHDAIVVDTAPTGHTLRLLSLPALTRTWVSVLDRMLEKHRFMSRLYTRRYRKDETDEFIEKLTRDVSRLASVLRDGRSSRFVVVTLLEPVVVAETERLLAALKERNIAAAGLIANQFLSDAGACALCRSIRAQQEACLSSLAAAQPHLPAALFPRLAGEIRGEAALAGFIASIRKAEPGPARGWDERCPPAQIALRPPHPARQLFLFCGKGGVGKTTLSCAFALELSRLCGGKRILLLSTDPAHSLSDCLARKVGADETEVAENLFAWEIDPEARFRSWKEAYSREIEEVFEGFSRRAGVEVQFDRQALSGLLDLTPPGLDELMCLAELAELVERRAYDLYVLDTAPAGHTLRFLELPAVIRGWFRAFFEILLKYRHLVRLPQASQRLVEMSRRIGRVHQLLADPARCEAVPVTTPAARQETGQMLAALERSGIPFQQLLVNQVVAEAVDCGHCSLAARRQLGQIREFRREFGSLDLVMIPRLAGELRGVDTLAGLLRFAPVEEPEPVGVGR